MPPSVIVFLESHVHEFCRGGDRGAGEDGDGGVGMAEDGEEDGAALKALDLASARRQVAGFRGGRLEFGPFGVRRSVVGGKGEGSSDYAVR